MTEPIILPSRGNTKTLVFIFLQHAAQTQQVPRPKWRQNSLLEYLNTRNTTKNGEKKIAKKKRKQHDKVANLLI